MKCKFLILKKRRVALLAAALLSAAIFAAANAPAAVTASAAARQLPIYCVDRDQKVCSISFDAAWGDGRMRLLCLCAFAGVEVLGRKRVPESLRRRHADTRAQACMQPYSNNLTNHVF